MPTTLKESESKSAGLDRLESVSILIIPVVILITIVILVLRHPAASIWISDAVQAEFVGTTGSSVIDPAPVAEPQRVLHAATEK
jgi:hypothetical protein